MLDSVLFVLLLTYFQTHVDIDQEKSFSVCQAALRCAHLHLKLILFFSNNIGVL